MTTQVMPETPIESFLILFAGILVMGLRLGLEVIARTAEKSYFRGFSFCLLY